MKVSSIKKTLSQIPQKLYHTYIIVITTTLLLNAATNPLPFGNILNKHQLKWFDLEMIMFAHFGIKTFYPSDDHMGHGNEDPARFNPTEFNAKQWIEAVNAGGFKGIVFTAKHHDGFCNWPTTSTDYNISASPYKNGNGDLLKEVSNALNNAGLWFGVYLSALDNHHKDYSGLSPELYNEKFQTQLKEICLNYGKIDELWFDGFGAGEMIIDVNQRKNTVLQYQPHAICFGEEVNKVDWPGNEKGIVDLPNWGCGVDQNPWEADCIAQGNWFYNDAYPMVSLDKLKEMYRTSVARGAVLLLNVAPNTKGLIDQSSIERLEEFGNWVKSFTENDVAYNKNSSASNIRGNGSQFNPAMALDKSNDTYWATDDSIKNATLEVDLEELTEINAVVIQEYMPLGQRVENHTIKIWKDNKWEKVISCSTIGHKRVHEFKPVITNKVLLEVKGKACPLISTFCITGKPQATLNEGNGILPLATQKSIVLFGNKFNLPNNFNTQRMTINVLDLKGRSIKQIELDNNCIDSKVKANSLSSGIYVLNIRSGKSSISRKCIIK